MFPSRRCPTCSRSSSNTVTCLPGRRTRPDAGAVCPAFCIGLRSPSSGRTFPSSGHHVSWSQLRHGRVSLLDVAARARRWKSGSWSRTPMRSSTWSRTSEGRTSCCTGRTGSKSASRPSWRKRSSASSRGGLRDRVHHRGRRVGQRDARYDPVVRRSDRILDKRA